MRVSVSPLQTPDSASPVPVCASPPLPFGICTLLLVALSSLRSILCIPCACVRLFPMAQPGSQDRSAQLTVCRPLSTALQTLHLLCLCVPLCFPCRSWGVRASLASTSPAMPCSCSSTSSRPARTSSWLLAPHRWGAHRSTACECRPAGPCSMPVLCPVGLAFSKVTCLVCPLDALHSTKLGKILLGSVEGSIGEKPESQCHNVRSGLHTTSQCASSTCLAGSLHLSCCHLVEYTMLVAHHPQQAAYLQAHLLHTRLVLGQP